MKCPKCPGTMRTHSRGNVHIEQCENCRGIFLDYGEIEALTQMQNQWANQGPNTMHQAPPPPQSYPVQPGWSHQNQSHHHQHPHYYKKRGFLGMLFSS
ncbi:MAG: zf-TFIIB domain-containing protein [Proteobacteria bacterium]|nr:zf-TFIIB domain-containing protein [Pseudomonadota bacterium]